MLGIGQLFSLLCLLVIHVGPGPLLGYMVNGGSADHMTSQMSFLWDPLSAALVIGLSIVVGLASHGVADILAAFAAAYSRERPDDNESVRYRTIVSSLRSISLGVGLLFTLISFVKMLSDMSDPEGLGPALAVALLPTLYGLILAELILAPSLEALEPDARRGRGGQLGLRRLGGVALAFAVLLFVTSWEGTVASFIDISALIAVLGIGFSASLRCLSRGGGLSVLVSAMRGDELEAGEATTHQGKLWALRQSIHAAAAAGFLLGLIQIAYHLEDPRHIGPAMALALLSCLYALVFAELAIAPLGNAIARRVSTGSQWQGRPYRSSLGLWSFFLLGNTLLFFAMRASLT